MLVVVVPSGVKAGDTCASSSGSIDLSGYNQNLKNSLVVYNESKTVGYWSVTPCLNVKIKSLTFATTYTPTFDSVTLYSRTKINVFPYILDVPVGTYAAAPDGAVYVTGLNIPVQANKTYTFYAKAAVSPVSSAGQPNSGDMVEFFLSDMKIVTDDIKETDITSQFEFSAKDVIPVSYRLRAAKPEFTVTSNANSVLNGSTNILNFNIRAVGENGLDFNSGNSLTFTLYAYSAVAVNSPLSCELVEQGTGVIFGSVSDWTAGDGVPGLKAITEEVDKVTIKFNNEMLAIPEAGTKILTLRCQTYGMKTGFAAIKSHLQASLQKGNGNVVYDDGEVDNISIDDALITSLPIIGTTIYSN